ncbi:MAG TPA: hypothetical protein VGD10_09865, partial [Allosphingosinicella sp.]|uniref:hypothetical protein n=1 Tax=Allosphingosinicella sp. TaxID=2823234 RepID=UPI002ED7CFE9
MSQKSQTLRSGKAARKGMKAGAGPILASLMLLPGAAVSQSAQPAQSAVSTVGVNLNITPRRLTFDRNTRSATVYIFNQGTTPATF